MTLLPGSRNVDARRVMYYDDDGGSALMADVYDASGALWKFQHNMPGIFPNVPAVVTVANFNVYDLHAGNYSSSAHYDNEVSPQWEADIGAARLVHDTRSVGGHGRRLLALDDGYKPPSNRVFGPMPGKPLACRRAC